MNKSNEKIRRWARIFGPVAVIILGVISFVYGYGRLGERVDRNERDILAGEAADFMRDEDVEEHGKLIVGMQKDVEYIKEAVDRIEFLLYNDRTRTGRIEWP